MDLNKISTSPEAPRTYDVLTKEQLATLLKGTSVHSFSFNIGRMHDIYRLPTNSAPTLDATKLGNDSAINRLRKFKQTLLDEVEEVDQIIEKLYLWEQSEAHEGSSSPMTTDLKQDALTDVADWLSDIIVYCRSEAMKFGLPLEDTLNAVMGSNFTKLASDGVPKYDANGKFLKDMTNFIPPEAAIKTMLFGIKGSRPHPYANIDNEQE